MSVQWKLERYFGGRESSSEKYSKGPVSPVNALVVIRATEELNLLKGAGAREAAGHGGVQAQEEVDSGGPYTGESPGRHGGAASSTRGA